MIGRPQNIMNELINEEAVYRTAPATPGLFKRDYRYHCDKLAEVYLGIVFKPRHMSYQAKQNHWTTYNWANYY